MQRSMPFSIGLLVSSDIASTTLMPPDRPSKIQRGLMLGVAVVFIISGVWTGVEAIMYETVFSPRTGYVYTRMENFLHALILLFIGTLGIVAWLRTRSRN